MNDYSGEESHISSSDFLVGIPEGGQHPLSEGSLRGAGAEEEVEEGGVERSDGLLIEVGVVGLDEGALVVLGLFDHHVDHFRVLVAELFEGVLLLGQGGVVGRHHHSVELFLLVSLSVLFHEDRLREVVEKSALEIVQVIFIHGSSVLKSRENINSLLRSFLE